MLLGCIGDNEMLIFVVTSRILLWLLAPPSCLLPAGGC